MSSGNQLGYIHTIANTTKALIYGLKSVIQRLMRIRIFTVISRTRWYSSVAKNERADKSEMKNTSTEHILKRNSLKTFHAGSIYNPELTASLTSWSLVTLFGSRRF